MPDQGQFYWQAIKNVIGQYTQDEFDEMFDEFSVDCGWHTFAHLVTIEAEKLKKALGNNKN